MHPGHFLLSSREQSWIEVQQMGLEPAALMGDGLGRQHPDPLPHNSSQKEIFRNCGAGLCGTALEAPATLQGLIPELSLRPGPTLTTTQEAWLQCPAAGPALTAT